MTGEKVHLLLSVRDKGPGSGGEESAGEKVRLFVAEGLLEKMGTRLQVIRTPGVETESFFELETVLADSAPAGTKGLPEAGQKGQSGKTAEGASWQ